MAIKCLKCGAEKSVSKSKKDNKLTCKVKDCKAVLTQSEYDLIDKEQRQVESLKYELNELKLKHSMVYFKNPTRSFNIGDEVSTTAYWKNTKVIDKQEDLYYLIEYISTQNNYGKPIETVKQSWVMWHDIFKKQTDEKDIPIFNMREKSIFKRVSFSNRQLESIIHTYYSFGIKLDPVYQRDFCWDLADKEKLIESIFSYRDIGKFVMIHLPYVNRETPCYEILDGKQRISTIIEFVEDRFKYKGYFYSEMRAVDKRLFGDAMIAWAEVSDLTEADKYHYFLELNISGKPQDQKHLDSVAKLLEKEKKNVK